jgi:hypothetical protein
VRRSRDRRHFFVVIAVLLGPLPFGLQRLQIDVEAIQAFVEKAAVKAEPLVDILQRPRLDPARPPLRRAAARDQAGALQHLEMLGHRRQAHGEGFRQLRHRGFAQSEPRQDGPAGGIGKGRKGSVEAQFHHPVK